MERDVIGEWARSLPIPSRRRRAIARELRTHLAESQRELELAGFSSEEAARESVKRLGSQEEIAQAFVAVHRRSRRSTIGLAFGLATAVMLGVFGAGGTLASSASQHAVHAKRSAPSGSPHAATNRTGSHSTGQCDHSAQQAP
jgi:hypothetical protein